jgi:hypothetical protein
MMSQLAVRLQLAYLRLRDHMETRVHDERGATTPETIAWAAFWVGLALGGFAIIRGWATGQFSIFR